MLDRREFWIFVLTLAAAAAVLVSIAGAETLLAVAALGSTVAVVQFILAYVKFLSTQNLADDPTVLARITGFMGHWMTFSGEQLLVWCAAVPGMLILRRRWSVALAAVSASL